MDALEPMLSDVATTLINHTARLPDDESNCLLLLSYPILQALWFAWPDILMIILELQQHSRNDKLQASSPEGH